MRRLRPALAVLALLSAAGALRAEVEVELRLGHGGRAVAGALTPAVVVVENREARPLAVSVELRPGGRGSGDAVRARAQVGPGGRQEITLLFRAWAHPDPNVILGFDRSVTVVRDSVPTPDPVRTLELRPPGAEAYDRVTNPSRLAIAAVGPRAGILPRPPEHLDLFSVAQAEMPSTWLAWEGLDAVFWRNPLEEEGVPPGAVEAVLRWVAFGGRLVVCATRRPELLAGTPLGDALPVNPGLPVPGGGDYLRVAEELAGLPPGSSARSIPPRGPFTPLGADPGRIAATRAYGLGSVTVLAFDPGRFSEARGDIAAGLYLLLLGVPSRSSPEGELEALATVSDRFPLGEEASEEVYDGIGLALRRGAVSEPPMGLLSLFIVLYILTIGPLDYFLLKGRGKLGYSALTFLGWAVAFALLAWFISFYLFSGRSLANRVTYVDVVADPGGGTSDRLLIQDLAAYYAPLGRALEIAPEGRARHADRLVSPYAYLYGGGGPAASGYASVQSTPLLGDTTLRIPFRSLRPARLVLEREALFPLEVALTRDRATVRNDLGFPLRDVLLLTAEGEAGMVWRIGDLDPGGVAEDVKPGVFRRGEDLFQHGARSRAFPDPKLLAPSVPAAGSVSAYRSLGRALAAYSVASLLAGERSVDLDACNAGFRAYRKAGLDRAGALSLDRALLVAWTEARDPFALPEGDANGLRITVIRKVVSE